MKFASFKTNITSQLRNVGPHSLPDCFLANGTPSYLLRAAHTADQVPTWDENNTGIFPLASLTLPRFFQFPHLLSRSQR